MEESFVFGQTPVLKCAAIARHWSAVNRPMSIWRGTGQPVCGLFRFGVTTGQFRSMLVRSHRER